MTPHIPAVGSVATAPSLVKEPGKLVGARHTSVEMKLEAAFVMGVCAAIGHCSSGQLMALRLAWSAPKSKSLRHIVDKLAASTQIPASPAPERRLPDVCVRNRRR